MTAETETGPTGTLATALAQTRMQRREGRPFFIDKMPNNFMHVGLIHLMLPNAKIVDARRHPLACCFSVFKQHFARAAHRERRAGAPADLPRRPRTHWRNYEPWLGLLREILGFVLAASPEAPAF